MGGEDAEPVNPALGDGSQGKGLIRCAMCRRPFPTGAHIERGSLEAAEPSAIIYECPFCGFTTAYSNADSRHEGE